MKNYTDEELALAIVKSGYSKELHYKELRHILSTLPDQTDEWQECNYEDIKGTDQKVRAVETEKGFYRMIAQVRQEAAVQALRDAADALEGRLGTRGAPTTLWEFRHHLRHRADQIEQEHQK